MVTFKRGDREKAYLFLILWIAIYCLTFVFVIVAQIDQAPIVEDSNSIQMSTIEKLTLLVVCTTLLPLSFFMRHYAKKAELRKLTIIATTLSFVTAFWCIGMLIAVICDGLC